MSNDATMKQDVSVLLSLQEKMVSIKESDPEWFAEYEDRDPMVADRASLKMLLDTAPNEFAQGLIVGVIMLRQQIAIVTDRPY